MHSLLLEINFNRAAEVSQTVSASWDELWKAVMAPGGLFGITCTIGALIGVICCAFYMVDFYTRIRDGSDLSPLVRLLWGPLVVILLLSGNGANLATVNQTLRGFINGTNEQVLAIAFKGANFDDSLSLLADFSSATNEITARRQQCYALINDEDRTKCNEAATAREQAMLAVFQQKHQNASSYNRFLESVAQTWEGVQSGDTTDALSAAAGAIASPLLPVLEMFLMACQIAFQQLIELAMLVTALVAPIAVGSSLFPQIEMKPLLSWFSSFFGLGMAKLGLNIMIGLYATQVVNAGPDSSDSLVNAVFVGILAPIVALGLARGGGIAVFQAGAGGLASVGSMGARVGGMAVAGYNPSARTPGGRIAGNAARAAGVSFINRISRK